ncbi:MAG: hypothetical protein QM820_64855 [Minicystis sp.]
MSGALFALSFGGCASPTGEDASIGSIAPVGDEDLGVAQQPDGSAICILDVHTDSGTFHFEGPNWILDAAEGLGPRTLSLNVAVFVQPQVATSTNFKPDPNVISAAVGYSVATRYQVAAGDSVSLLQGQFRRLEAYTAFQRTIWEIRDGTCLNRLGVGVTYKPIGIYFKTVDAHDVAISDLGVYVFNAPCVGPGCTSPGPSVPEPVSGNQGSGKGSSGETPDGGTGDGGATDGGVTSGGSAGGGSTPSGGVPGSGM